MAEIGSNDFDDWADGKPSDGFTASDFDTWGDGKPVILSSSGGTASPSTAVPVKAVKVDPTDSESDVAIDVTLDWSDGGGADTFDVYFAAGATPSLVATSLAASSYNPGTLLNNTTYSWRIDSENANGTTQGDVWSFTTVASEGEESGTVVNMPFITIIT
jgi:hypothetical protein